jgi:hypothetical protein
MELKKCEILFITNSNGKLNLVKMSLEMNFIVISIDSILILIVLAHFFTNFLACVGVIRVYSFTKSIIIC